MGLGHAILCAREFVGDEPFAVLLGDDIIDAMRPCLAQLLDVYAQYGGAVLGLEQVPMENISSYGCVKGDWMTERAFEVVDLVEKPKPDEAPSDLAIIGRYILTPEIFPILERQEPGKGGEIQLTDAIRTLLSKESVYGCRFEGIRHDCGDKFGFLKATVDMALKRGEFNGRFKAFLRQRLQECEEAVSVS
jgi:UTP--glucose-1-phosphate uridylyltransferase